MKDDLYTRAVSGLLFPLHERLKGHDSVRLREQLEQSQWLNESEQKALQSRKLQSFMIRVYKAVPYYRQLLDDQGINPRDIDSSEKLSAIPFLSKEIIRNNEDNLRAAGAQDLKRFNTGGSSGSPLIFYLNQERISHDVAAKWRATRWWDVDIGDREIVAWGSPIELGGQDRIKMLRDRAFRSLLIPAFDMSEQHLLDFIEKIRSTRPKMLFGYPSVYDLIARKSSELKIPLNKLGIKVAFVTSERLYEHQRENIEQAFGCPVANGYGGRDAGFIAHQCPQGGMHISSEDIIVEIVGTDGQVLPPGQSGEIVVTHLATSAFPFIRYRTGDVGSLSTQSCSCRRGLPMLESIEGRSTDFVVARDGTIMHGLALIYVLRELPGIREFKVIQQSLDQTDVMIVPEDDVLNEELVTLIESGFRQRLGEEVTINVRKISAVEPEKSGKYRYIQSKVAV